MNPDGFNINKDCGSTSPELLVEQVLAQQADVGIAFDGDGDRLIMVDHKGNIVDGDEILYVIASDRLRRNIEFGGVVGTLMSNLGLELGLEKLNVPFARTNVGDRYVMAELNNRGWSLGGESSGHIVCLDVTTTGDGIVSALQALAAMISGETQLFDLCRKMQKMPQTMINVRVSDRSLALDHAATLTAVRDIEARLGKQGRVLLRASGTEPVIRVMIEGEDQLLVASMAGELADVIVNGAL